MGDFEHTDCAVFIGKNPWQSHGFPESRNELNKIRNDDERKLVVMDPAGVRDRPRWPTTTCGFAPAPTRGRWRRCSRSWSKRG